MKESVTIMVALSSKPTKEQERLQRLDIKHFLNFYITRQENKQCQRKSQDSQFKTSKG